MAPHRDHIYVEHFSDYEPNPRDVFGWALRMGDHKLVAVKGAEPMLYDLAPTRWRLWVFWQTAFPKPRPLSVTAFNRA